MTWPPHHVEEFRAHPVLQHARLWTLAAHAAARCGGSPCRSRSRRPQPCVDGRLDCSDALTPRRPEHPGDPAGCHPARRNRRYAGHGGRTGRVLRRIPSEPGRGGRGGRRHGLRPRPHRGRHGRLPRPTCRCLAGRPLGSAWGGPAARLRAGHRARRGCRRSLRPLRGDPHGARRLRRPVARQPASGRLHNARGQYPSVPSRTPTRTARGPSRSSPTARTARWSS